MKKILIVLVLLFLLSPAVQADMIYRKPAFTVSDTAYDVSWDEVTDVAPSKNAVYDKIETLGGGGGSGDVTDVGDCTEGACLDGTSDGGTWIKFYDADGAGTLITPDIAGAVTWTLPTTAGTLIHTETDPVFIAWDKSTGISITESQISDLQAYLTAEEDPDFSAWDKSTGISITESQISDLQSYLLTEVDPTVDSSAEIQAIIGAGIYESAGITESDISDLQSYLLDITGESIFDLSDFPADPDADKYLKWDDDPGELVWADAGAGDVTDVWDCASGDCKTLTIGESEYLIGGAIDGATDPYISLPQGADVSSVTGEGRISWDTDGDKLYIGTGAAAKEIISTETDPTVDTSAEIQAIIGASVYEPAGITASDISNLNAGTDITADLEEETHASEHAVAATDTIFPADPNADKYLMWDDNPGILTWADAGGTVAYDDIADPDAAGSISFDAGETGTYLFTGNYASGSQYIIQQSTGNPIGGGLLGILNADKDSYLTEFQMSQGADAGDYAKVTLQDTAAAVTGVHNFDIVSGVTNTTGTTTETAPVFRLQGHYVKVGDAGTVNYADGDGDLYVEDELEVDGNVYFAAQVQFLYDNVLAADKYLNFDPSGLSMVTWETTGNDYFLFRTAVNNAAYSGNIIIAQDLNIDWGQPLVADPHLRIQSSDQTSVNDFIQFWHDQTDGNIQVGSGNLNLTATGIVLGNGATSAGLLQINEDTSDGTQNATFTVPALVADTDYILPADDGGVGEILSTNGSGVLDWVADAGGAETNSLETICTGIATTEIPIGTAADTVVYAALSGEATMANNGAVTIADSVAVSSWNLTTPTITTSLTTSTPTTLSAAELDRLDGLAGIITTDATACTDLEGVGLSIDTAVLKFTPAELEGVSFGGGAAATIVHTFNVSGTDTTMTYGSGVITTSNGFTVTGDLTVSGDDIQLGATGVKITDDTDGAITFLGTSAGASEDLRINLDDTANIIVMDSTTAATELDWLGTSGSAALFGLGSTGVVFSDDADGALTIQGRSAGFDETWIMNLDDTDNTAVFTGTAVNWDTSAIDIIYKAVSIEAGALVAASVDGDDINPNIAGRSLTLTAASPDTLDIDSEVYEQTKCIYWESPVAGDDFKSVYIFKTAATITQVFCESDQTVNMTLQEDDGSPADIETTDFVCDATPPTQTNGFEDAAMAAGSRLDFDVTSVSGTPTWCSMCISFTPDD